MAMPTTTLLGEALHESGEGNYGTVAAPTRLARHHDAAGTPPAGRLFTTVFKRNYAPGDCSASTAREFSMLRFFCRLAPQYAPAPVGLVAQNDSRRDLHIAMAHGGLPIVKAFTCLDITPPELLSLVLQSLHCMLLVGDRMRLADLHPDNLLARRGGDGAVRLCLVDAGFWSNRGGTLNGNLTNLCNKGWHSVFYLIPSYSDALRRVLECMDAPRISSVPCDVLAIARDIARLSPRDQPQPLLDAIERAQHAYLHPDTGPALALFARLAPLYVLSGEDCVCLHVAASTPGWRPTFCFLQCLHCALLCSDALTMQGLSLRTGIYVATADQRVGFNPAAWSLDSGDDEWGAVLLRNLATLCDEGLRGPFPDTYLLRRILKPPAAAPPLPFPAILPPLLAAARAIALAANKLDAATQGLLYRIDRAAGALAAF